MKKDNLLIVCYDIKDFKTIEKINRANYEIIIVASNDYRVHEKCSNLKYINDVTFLQKAIPYTVVAKDVITIINKVNEYYNQVSTEVEIFQTEHMVWPFHIEGGNNTQIIQDTLLYIQSLNTIIDQYKIENIITFSNSNSHHIEQVVHQVCISKSILYKNIKKFKINFSKKRLKNFIRPFYYLFKTLRIKIESSSTKVKNEGNIALFWLFNSVKKHIDNAVFINSVLKKSGFTPVLFSWRVLRIKNQTDLNIQQIEKYIEWKDIFISVFKNIQALVYQRKFIKVYNTYEFKYLDIDITDIVKPIVMYQILVEASDSYRFSKGFDNFKKYIDVKIMSGDLGRQKLGLLVEKTFPEDMPKFAFSTFLTSKNTYVEYMRQRYSDCYWDNFKYFVQNEIEKKNILEQINIDPQNIIIYGTLRAVNTNENIITKEEALKQLRIEDNYDYYIMFDYPNQLNGYQSLEESVSTLITVFDIVKDRKDIALIIKPHPSADISFLEIVKKRYPYKNIFYMGKTDNPIIGLVISDILITKYSTLGIEAIKYNTMVISIQLDGSEIFKLYEYSATYVYRLKELESLIKNIFESETNYMKYLRNSKLKGAAFLQEFYSKLDDNLVVQHLKNKNKDK